MVSKNNFKKKKKKITSKTYSLFGKHAEQAKKPKNSSTAVYQ